MRPAPSRRHPDAAGVDRSELRCRPVELEVGVGGDEDRLLDVRHQLVEPSLRRGGGDQLFVAARGAVAEADRSQSVDFDHRLSDEAGEERPRRSRVLRDHPGLSGSQRLAAPDSLPSRALRQQPFSVSADEDRGHGDGFQQCTCPLRLGPPSEIASEHDQVEAFSCRLRQYGGQSCRIAVNVGKYGDPLRRLVETPKR
jgi:hypothetical protein